MGGERKEIKEEERDKEGGKRKKTKRKGKINSFFPYCQKYLVCE